MDELIEALSELEPTKGDTITRLPLTEEQRAALDARLLRGDAKDADIARILKAAGHDVTPDAVSYYRRKLERRAERRTP